MVDYQTENMEELQWARLLVKRNSETPPNAVEVWVEELCYSVTLWWEVRPVMKVSTTGKKGKAVAAGEEVGGDVSAHASERVTVAMEGSRLEDTLLTADGTRGQSNGSGQTPNPSRSDDGSPSGPQVSGGLGLLGQAKPSRWSKASDSPGLIPFGPVDSGIGKPTEKAKPTGLLQGAGLDSQSPSSFGSFRAQAEKGLPIAECSRRPLRGPDATISPFWVKDGQWGLYGDETQWGGDLQDRLCPAGGRRKV